MKIELSLEKHLNEWDNFVYNSINGTIFHKISFLKYHLNKFENREQFLIIKKGDAIFAQMAILKKFDEKNSFAAFSPYGASVGGPILKRLPTYSESKEFVKTLKEFFSKEQIGYCEITFPLSIYSEKSIDVFIFAFLEAGFVMKNMDISSIANLNVGSIFESISSRARNVDRKAKNNVKFSIQHRAPISDFIETLDSTYSRHETKPTHSRTEILYLTSNLSDEIFVDVAYFDGQPAAGILYFKINNRVLSTFYLTQTKCGRENSCLVPLIINGMERAKLEGYQWFDFGTSSVNMKARDNIFLFKENFSLQGSFRKTISWRNISY